MAIAVLGGGISGLAAAHYLQSLASTSRIVVFEASNRFGGWIDSAKYEDGTIFEFGPRTLRFAGNAGANTVALAESLGLADRIISVPYSHPSTKNRMIKTDGTLHKLPNSFTTLFKKQRPFSRPLVFSALTDLRAEKVISDDESLFSFVNRRFGPEVASYAVDPMVRGIFAGNAKDLSVMCLGKRLHELEQKYGSVIKGMIKGRKDTEKMDPALLRSDLVQKGRQEKWSVWSLSGGLKTLVDVLVDKLEADGVELRKNTPVRGIKDTSSSRVSVQTDNEEIEVDRVIACLPAKSLSSLIKTTSPDFSSLLGSIPFVTVGVVNLEFPGQLIKEAAFGYLVPSFEPGKVLGVIFDTCTFPQGDRTIFTVMMGGYWFQQLFGESPTHEELLQVALKEVKETLDIRCMPVRHHVSILQDCIPQYTVGHNEVVTNARKLLKDLKLPLSIGGYSYDGVGVNDSIMSAKRAVLS